MIAHISSTVEEDMLYLADAAYDSGYDAVMVLPQYYYAQTSRQLLSYFRSLDRKLAGDWFIYNFPARTGCDVDAHLVRMLAESCPRFIGIKDTVDCASHTRAIVNAVTPLRKDFAVFAGFDEYFVPNLMNGGAGVLSGLNNVVPELLPKLCGPIGPATSMKSPDYTKKLGDFPGYMPLVMILSVRSKPPFPESMAT